MKNRIIFLSLLFILCLFFCSCNNAETNYNGMSLSHVLEVLNEKEYLTKEEYLLKINTLYELDRTLEAKEAVIAYLFLVNDNDAREPAVPLYLDYENSDMLNILLLKTSDGLKTRLFLFKSMYNLGMYDNAYSVLKDYIQPSLSSIEQYVSILIKYPIDNDYTLDFFKSWFSIITVEEMEKFVSLFTEFLNLDLSSECYNNCIEFVNEISQSDYSYIAKKINIKR